MSNIEELLKAKIPCAETGIEIKHTTCDICAPAHHCGMNAYVKDGKVIKVEGWDEYPLTDGHLCTKGAANKEYIYRKDRIKTPLKRIGKRGEGKFKEITWDEAYAEIAENLLKTKEKYGPESVLFAAGFAKWYRPYLHRFAFSFGSPNFSSDCVVCQTTTALSWATTTGKLGFADTNNSNVLLGWALNPYYSNPAFVKNLLAQKARGLKIIIIDPKVTPAVMQLADIHLKIKTDTDGVLAHGMANLIIQNGWADMDYINNHVYGFEEYAEYVKQYDLDTVAEITGLDKDDIYRATEMYATNGPAALTETASPLTHHVNGFQTYRAVIALQAITGNYDRVGGTIPADYTYNHNVSGFTTREHEFTNAPMPKDKLKMGVNKFPMWDNRYYQECQAVELEEYVKGNREYPTKMIFGMGFNYRMFPQSEGLINAIDENLDFFVNTDLFLTDSCKHADIVLPVCSSFERGEFRARAGHMYYSSPAIEPLYESKSDVQILTELANIIDLDDDLLKAGYEACIDYIIQDTGYTVKELKEIDFPVVPKNLTHYVEREFSKNGMDTPTGKFEIKSSFLEGVDPSLNLSAIPKYFSSFDGDDKELFPLTLSSGSRLPGALHSRLHDVPSLTTLRPGVVADINPIDAERYGLEDSDKIYITTILGKIKVGVNITSRVNPGNVLMFHGHKGCNTNDIIPLSKLDPYTGFASYRSVSCNIEKVIGE